MTYQQVKSDSNEIVAKAYELEITLKDLENEKEIQSWGQGESRKPVLTKGEKEVMLGFHISFSF